MSHHLADQEATDLHAIAGLIDRSSLGSPAARAARDKLQPDDALALLERLHLRKSTIRAGDLAYSGAVLRPVAEVMPAVIGTAQYISLPEDREGPFTAINLQGDIEYSSGHQIALRPSPERTIWYIYEPSQGQFRYTFSVFLEDMGSHIGCNDTWDIRVAIVWRIASLAQVLRKRVVDIGEDLMPVVRWHLAQHLIKKVGPMPTADRLHMERDLELKLRSCGLDVTAVIQPVFDRRVKPTVTGAEFIAALMGRSTRGGRNSAYERHLAGLLRRSSDQDQASFCVNSFGALVEALEVSQVARHLAPGLAEEAFRDLIRAWDGIEPEDRVLCLAGMAAQQLGVLAESQRQAAAARSSDVVAEVVAEPESDRVGIAEGSGSGGARAGRALEGIHEILALHSQGRDPEEIASELQLSAAEVRDIVVSNERRAAVRRPVLRERLRK